MWVAVPRSVASGAVAEEFWLHERAGDRGGGIVQGHRFRRRVVAVLGAAGDRLRRRQTGVGVPGVRDRKAGDDARASGPIGGAGIRGSSDASRSCSGLSGARRGAGPAHRCIASPW